MRKATASIIAFLFVFSASAQIPEDGIELWLRADSGVTVDGFNRVESWQDQSNNAYLFTQPNSDDWKPLLGAGVLNGQNVIRFDGTDDWLSAGDILENVFVGPGKQYALFVVLTSFRDDNLAFIAKTANSRHNESQRQLSFDVWQGELRWNVHRSLGTAPGGGVDSESIQIVQPFQFSQEPILASFLYDEPSSTESNGIDRFTIRLDGIDQSIEFAGGTSFVDDIDDGTAHFAVGALVNSSGTSSGSDPFTFQGDIAEILWYNRTLTDLELRQIEAYLGGKYGLDVVGVAVEEPVDVPSGYRLEDVYPNPFNPQATVSLELDNAQQVKISVHDLLGREVALLHDGILSSKSHSFNLSGDNLPSGIYIVRVVGEQFVASRQAVLLK